jgi:hypothetical protein
MKLKGAYERFSRDSTGVNRTQEFGIETSLRFPKFLFPFLDSENFIKKYNPVTSIQAAFNYQLLPVYTRSVANATFGYTWNDGPYRTHSINPMQLNFVKIKDIDSVYYEKVIAPSAYLVSSYQDVLITSVNYSYTYSQKQSKARHHLFFRANAEAAGNLLNGIMRLTNAPVDTATGKYNIFGQPYAQFIKTDFDIRYTRIINDISSIVYRGFVGVGIPYKNSLAMPFERQYYEGGANGIRGWQVRTLGPGSVEPPTGTYVNQTGDIKIEGNIEYRFKLFWLMEGAVFVDIGNIWAIKADAERPGAEFRFNKFVDDLAVGSGLGLRFDFTFVILRVDLGFKLRDPSKSDDTKWLTSRPLRREDVQPVIAIGYPF